jgi:hypothetical protein
MTIILKANKVNLFISSVLFVFWYHSPNFLDTPRIVELFLLFSLSLLTSVTHCVQFLFKGMRQHIEWLQ